jgi:hypothetical protein
MRELVAKWRNTAHQRHDRALELGPCSAGLAQATEAGVLWDCANELEQAWHNHAHDGAWESPGECRVCDQERGTPAV